MYCSRHAKGVFNFICVDIAHVYVLQMFECCMRISWHRRVYIFNCACALIGIPIVAHVFAENMSICVIELFNSLLRVHSFDIKLSRCVTLNCYWHE